MTSYHPKTTHSMVHFAHSPAGEGQGSGSSSQKALTGRSNGLSSNADNVQSSSTYFAQGFGLSPSPHTISSSSQLPPVSSAGFADNQVSSSRDLSETLGLDVTSILFVPEQCTLNGTKPKPMSGQSKSGRPKRYENSFILYMKWKYSQISTAVPRKYIAELWEKEQEDVKRYFRGLAERKAVNSEWEFHIGPYQLCQTMKGEERAMEQQAWEVPSTDPIAVGTFTDYSQLDPCPEGTSGLQRGSARVESRAQRSHNPYPKNGRTRVAETAFNINPVEELKSIDRLLFLTELASKATSGLVSPEEFITVFTDCVSRF